MDTQKTPSRKGVSVGIVTLMVAGNMMGSGIFLLPASLATTGSISILGWLITSLGVIALAMVFARLAALNPLPGGPYAYARKSLGNYMGFNANLIYWMACIVGNVSLSVAGLSYVSHYIPPMHNPWFFFSAQVFFIWFVVWVNNQGAHWVGKIQFGATFFALIPIVGIASLGWFHFHPKIFLAGWNVSGQSTLSAIGSTLNYTLWAFIGVESASVAARVVDNPKINVPIATIGGVLIVTLCYILSSTVIMGIIPNEVLKNSNAPYADAIGMVLGQGGMIFVTICAALCCFGSFVGWTLLVAQSAKAAADDGLFPRIFSKLNKKEVPDRGLFVVAIISTAIATLTISPSATQQFGKLASIAVVMTLLPYIYSCISLRILNQEAGISRRQYVIDMVLSGIAFVYCLLALINTEKNITRWALIFAITSIIFYKLSLTGKANPAEGYSSGNERIFNINISTWIALFIYSAIGFALIGMFITYSPT